MKMCLNSSRVIGTVVVAIASFAAAAELTYQSARDAVAVYDHAELAAKQQFVAAMKKATDTLVTQLQTAKAKAMKANNLDQASAIGSRIDQANADFDTLHKQFTIDASPVVTSLTIELFIDGNTDIVLHKDGVFLRENGAAKPGRHGGKNLPTFFNGEAWMPQWGNPQEERGNDETAPIAMNLKNLSHAKVTLRYVSEERKRAGIEGRDPLQIKNESDQLTITIPDTQSGQRWYGIDISFE